MTARPLCLAGPLGIGTARTVSFHLKSRILHFRAWPSRPRHHSPWPITFYIIPQLARLVADTSMRRYFQTRGSVYTPSASKLGRRPSCLCPSLLSQPALSGPRYFSCSGGCLSFRLTRTRLTHLAHSQNNPGRDQFNLSEIRDAADGQ